MSPTVPTDTTISQDNPSVNSYSMQNTAENAQEGKKSIAGTRLSELVEKYGAIQSGENPARDVSVPEKTSDGRKVSQTVRTILEAKVTPDEAVPTIVELVTKGDRFDRRRLEIVAGHLRKIANSTVANEKLVPMLEESFRYFARLDDADAYHIVCTIRAESL